MPFEAMSPGHGPHPRRLLVIDSAYTWDMLISRDLSVLVTHRDLDGYFDHVWTVHPVGGIFEPEHSPARYGAPVTRTLNPLHTHIEGKIGRFKLLRYLSPLNFLLAEIELSWKLSRLVRRERISVVRSEDPLYNGMLALLIAAVCRIPVMMAVWGNPGAIRAHTRRPLMPRFFRWVWLEEIVERAVLRRADRVLVQNQDNLAFVLSRGVPRHRTAIFLLGNAVHSSHFVEPQVRDDAGNDLAPFEITGQKLLLCISRLEPLKLTDHVVHVVACLKSRGWNVKALFAGEGNLRGRMELLAEELSVREQIVFCGPRPQEWLARVIPRVDVVVSPLTGRALVEAALGAAPIVAYDIDWQSEFIESGVTGELVPHLQYGAMADAVERILRDPDYGRRLGANARRRALAFTDPDAIHDMQARVYDELLTPP